MAVIEEVTADYEKARADQAFLDELDRLQTDYTGRPSPLYEATRLQRARRWRAAVPQARRPQPHRFSQDQQRARAGAAGQADGQDAGHRRDRRRSARGGHRDRVRAAGPRMRHLHGCGRHRPPGAQRRADAVARRRGGVGRDRFADPQGRHQRGVPGLGDQRRRHLLLLRHRGGPASVPGDGARFPARHRTGGAGADPGPGASPARRGDRVRRWRFQRDRHLPRVHRRSGRAAGRLSRPPATASRPGGTPRPSPAARPVRSRVRTRTCCRTRTARPSNRIRSQRVWTTRASDPSMRSSRTSAGPSTGRSPTPRRWTRSRCCAARRASSRRSNPRTRWRERSSWAPSSGEGAVILVNLSGRGDKDMETAAQVVRPDRRRGSHGDE